MRGLALDGAAGVEHVLRSILAEADLLMAVDGYPDVKALRGAVVRVEVPRGAVRVRAEADSLATE